jgi:hypothetical protein
LLIPGRELKSTGDQIMKKNVLLSLMALAIVCLFTRVASADAVDFKMNVLDPVPPTNPAYTLYIINAVPFPVTFTPCVAGELPSGTPLQNGCFAGKNDTQKTWTQLQLIFPNTSSLGSQQASCGGLINSIYQSATCSLTPSGLNYLLMFSVGAIPPGDYFFISEDGMDPARFPEGTASPGFVPEPSSLILMSSGMMMFGLLVHTKRRRMIGASLRS